MDSCNLRAYNSCMQLEDPCSDNSLHSTYSAHANELVLHVTAHHILLQHNPSVPFFPGLGRVYHVMQGIRTQQPPLTRQARAPSSEPRKQAGANTAA